MLTRLACGTASFKDFQLKYYSDAIDPKYGASPRAVMERTRHNILIGTDGKARLRNFSVPAAHRAGTDLAPDLKKGYAAPEQFIGGEISPASDIHALGMLINECFKGELNGCWERIVACATSSIPERRYRNVLEFIGAVRRRHWRRIASVVCGILFAAGIFLLKYHAKRKKAES